MKVIFLILMALMPTTVFAEAKSAQRHVISNIKVKEINSIGKPQEVEKSVLLDLQSGQVWLFVGGKEDNDVRLIPIRVEKSDTKGKGK